MINMDAQKVIVGPIALALVKSLRCRCSPKIGVIQPKVDHKITNMLDVHVRATAINVGNVLALALCKSLTYHYRTPIRQ